MSFEIIEFSRHKGLKVGAGLALEEIVGVNHCPISLSELSEAACDYPLVFMKSSDTGKFRLVALMGFRPDRNLFVLGDQYLATYLPKQLARAPFALTQEASGNLTTAIDVNHPRSQDRTGRPLFHGDGRDSEFLAQTRTQLHKMVEDQAATSLFIDAILDQDLLATMPIDLDPVGGQQGERLDGLYSISRSKLANLSDAKVLEFHHCGYLAALATITASVAQFVRLQQLHNAHCGRDGRIIALQNVSVGLPE